MKALFARFLGPWSMTRRTQLVVAFCAAPLVLGLLKTLWLQGVQGETLRAAVDEQTQVSKEVVGRRGSIVDSMGRTLATSMMQAKLELVQPVPSGNEAFLIEFLSGILNLSKEEVTIKFGFAEGWKSRVKSEEQMAESFRAMAQSGRIHAITVQGWLREAGVRHDRGLHPVYYVTQDLPPVVAAGLTGILTYTPEQYVSEKVKKSDDRPELAPPDGQILWLQQRLQGLRIHRRAYRVYPQATLAGQVIGHVREPDAKFVNRHGREPASVDLDGRSGVEGWFEEDLTGRKAEYQGLRGRKGRTILTHSLEPQELDGRTLQLTIDSYLQARAEKHLTDALIAAKAFTGVAIIMDVDTGHLLAVAQSPSFNPNPQVLRTYGDDDIKNWESLAFTRAYEPGSTLKPLIAGMVMQQGIASLYDDCFGEWGVWRVVPDKREKPITDLHKLGHVTLEEAIKYSSNICMGKWGLKLGAQTMYDYLIKLRIGQRTGVLPRPTREANNVLFDVAEFCQAAQLSQLPDDLLEMARQCEKWARVLTGPSLLEGTGRLGDPKKWTTIDVANRAFGQGLSATPVQVTAAFNTIANKGVWVQPVLVKGYLDSRGKLISETPRVEERIFSAGVAADLMQALQSVVKPGGTGEAANVYNVDVGGKTGTSQTFVRTEVEYIDREGNLKKVTVGAYGDRWSAWFAGVAPIDNPEITVLVMIVDPHTTHTGGAVAAPVFSKIVSDALSYLSLRGDPALGQASMSTPSYSVTPNASKLAPEKEGKLPKRTADGDTVLVPDFKGLSVARVIALAASANLAVSAQGAGWADEQTPKAGSLVPAGSTVRVNFSVERRNP